MARSLRSQTKKRTRAIKRETIFKPVEDARLERLAAAQAEAAKKPSVGDFMDDKEPTTTTEATTEAMVVEEETPKKISTSGPRSGRHARKIREKKKKGKKGTNKF